MPNFCRLPCPETLESVNTGVILSDAIESAATCTAAMSFTGKGILPWERNSLARAVRVVFRMFSGQMSTYVLSIKTTQNVEIYRYVHSLNVKAKNECIDRAAGPATQKPSYINNQDDTSSNGAVPW
jgi:hypothetical protein